MREYKHQSEAIEEAEEFLQDKLDTLRELNAIMARTGDKTKVLVDLPPDANEVEVRVRAEEETRHFKELHNLTNMNKRVKYDMDSGTLTFSFKIDLGNY